MGSELDPEEANAEVRRAQVPVQVFTDGAATHAAIPQLRRAGWGVWIPDFPSLSASQPLLGPCHMALRAEVRALVAALECTSGYASVWSDSRFVVTGAEYLARGIIPAAGAAPSYRGGWRVWRTFPCRRRLREVPLKRPVVPATQAAAAGRAAHDLRSEDGRMWCTQCKRSVATRWRAKLGTCCPAGKLPGQCTLRECINFFVA